MSKNNTTVNAEPVAPENVKTDILGIHKDVTRLVILSANMLAVLTEQKVDTTDRMYVDSFVFAQFIGDDTDLNALTDRIHSMAVNRVTTDTLKRADASLNVLNIPWELDAMLNRTAQNGALAMGDAVTFHPSFSGEITVTGELRVYVHVSLDTLKEYKDVNGNAAVKSVKSNFYAILTHDSGTAWRVAGFTDRKTFSACKDARHLASIKDRLSIMILKGNKLTGKNAARAKFLGLTGEGAAPHVAMPEPTVNPKA